MKPTIATTATLREATVEDAEARAGVWLAAALEAYGSIFPADAPKPRLDELEAIERADLRDPATTGFVAELHGAIVATIAVGAWARGSTVGRLARLYVHPAHWRRGVGALLYQRAEAKLRTKGFAVAQLWVLRDNARARAMYERRGWVATGETALVHPGVEDLLYRRGLC